MRKQFFKSAFAVSLISSSILPLTISSAWGTDTASKQQKQSVIIATANKSRISQLIKILEKRTINYASEAAQDASKELVRIGQPAVPQLIEALEQNRSLLTFGITETLSEIAKKDASIVPILVDKLGDKNPQVRLAAMFALMESQSKNVLIKAAQNSENTLVRSSAMIALKKDSESLSSLSPILKSALNDENPTIRRSAAISSANYSVSLTEVMGILKNGLKDDDSLIRLLSAWTLLDESWTLPENQRETTSATTALIEASKDESSIVRWFAIYTLLRFSKENPQAVPEIIEAINDKDIGVRYTAIKGILDSEKKYKAAVPELIQAVDDDNEDVQDIAIRALGNIGSEAKAAKPKLLAILRNKQESDQIRGSAARALSRMKKYGQSAIPILVNILEDKQSSEELAEDAVRALGDMEKYALEAIPVLIKIWEDKHNDSYLAYTAASALEKIDSQAFIPYLVKRLTNEDFSYNSMHFLNRIASEMKKNKNSYSQAELAKAISEFETALEIIDNSEWYFSQEKIKTLQESLAELKK